MILATKKHAALLKTLGIGLLIGCAVGIFSEYFYGWDKQPLSALRVITSAIWGSGILLCLQKKAITLLSIGVLAALVELKIFSYVVGYASNPASVSAGSAESLACLFSIVFFIFSWKEKRHNEKQ